MEFIGKVASIMIKNGAKVFCADLGNAPQLENFVIDFNKIYNADAQYVIIFVSKNYKKEWANLQLRKVLQTTLELRNEYVILAKFDDTELDDLNINIGFIDLRKETPESFAAIALRRLGY
jgi:hypothetical protein